MPVTRWTIAATMWFLIFSNAEAVDAPDALFQSAEILDVRIVAPLKTILSNRSLDDELPGTFHFTNSAGEQVQLDVEIKTRGRFRRERDICKFPPLRIDFKTSQAKGTIFQKQDKLKLVTHCQRTSRYEQTMFREHTAYLILNILSDASYRVRMLRITYVDSDKNKDGTVHYGFFIEHRDRLAKRLHASVIDIPKTRPNALEPGYANLISMFHYFIGNTDFSPISGAEGERCCHNHDLIGNEGELFLSVPYDFDQSGLVNAPHAVTNPRFKLRSAKQRLYRGRCINNPELTSTVALFLEKRDEIKQLAIVDGLLNRSSEKHLTKFIDDFYKVLESDKQRDAKITKACRS